MITTGGNWIKSIKEMRETVLLAGEQTEIWYNCEAVLFASPFFGHMVCGMLGVTREPRTKMEK